MACGLALKRPHDYESYLNGSESPDGGPSEAKRHCPPFRAQLGTIAASLPSHNAAALLNKNSSDSPFAAVASRCQLTSPQLDAFLRAEIRYLRRRRVIPRRCSVEANAAGGAADEDEGLCEPPFKLHAEYRAAPKSPQSGSDSDGEPSNSSMRASTTVSKNGDVSRMMPTSSAVASTLAMVDRPQFSLRQVQLICERLLKEQEIRLRGEFENALNRRLEEQHDQYVQFAEEQLSTRRAEVTVGECSYLS